MSWQQRSFQDQPAHQSETPSEIVTTIQFEILKLISEKDDLVKENEALKHYRESFIKLQEENALLRERLELMQIIPTSSTEKEKQLWTSPAWRRSSPDGQEDLSEKVKKEFKEENRRRLWLLKKYKCIMSFKILVFINIVNHLTYQFYLPRSVTESD